MKLKSRREFYLGMRLYRTSLSWTPNTQPLGEMPLFYSVTKIEIETRTSVSDCRGGGHGWTLQIKMANWFFISQQTSFLDFYWGGAQVFKSRFKAGASHRKSYKAFYPRSNSTTSAFYLVKFNHQTSSGLISKVAFQEEGFHCSHKHSTN